MNSIATAKALSSTFDLAGYKCSYEYRALSLFEGKKVAAYITQQQPKFAKIAKDWSADTNSEWICRNYLSAKMIMMATLQLNSLEYAKSRNLRMIVPYLAYYTVFSLLRAIIFMNPDSKWDGGQIIKLTHQKVDNLAFDTLRYLDGDWAKSSAASFRRLRHERELISYWHPSSGDSEFEPIDYLLDLSIHLAEIAQLNSEILEKAINKYSNSETWIFHQKYVNDLSQIELVGEVHVDTSDLHRLDYISRKWPRPTTLQHSITEGHFDDFFGVWCSMDEGGSENFDPDLNSRLIFDFF